MVSLHFKPCHHGLTRVFMYLSFSVIQENAIFDRVEDGFNLEVLPRWAMSSSKLKFEKVLFHSEYPIELMEQEDRVMEHNTRSHETQSDSTMCYVTHAQKEKLLEKPRSFLLSTVSRSSFLRDQCIIHACNSLLC
jgi:hypothetical protein